MVVGFDPSLFVRGFDNLLFLTRRVDEVVVLRGLGVDDRVYGFVKGFVDYFRRGRVSFVESSDLFSDVRSFFFDDGSVIDFSLSDPGTAVLSVLYALKNRKNIGNSVFRAGELLLYSDALGFILSRRSRCFKFFKYICLGSMDRAELLDISGSRASFYRCINKLLSYGLVEVSREGYSLTWTGEKTCMLNYR